MSEPLTGNYLLSDYFTFDLKLSVINWRVSLEEASVEFRVSLEVASVDMTLFPEERSLTMLPA